MARLLVESTGSSLRVTRGSLPADAEVIGGPFSLLALGGAARTRPVRAARSRSAAMRSWRRNSASWRGCSGPIRRRSCRSSSAMWRRIGSGGWRAARWLGPATRPRPCCRIRGEYFGHERGDLVPREEGEQFLRGVDALREDVDRLDARLELLQQRLAAK